MVQNSFSDEEQVLYKEKFRKDNVPVQHSFRTNLRIRNLLWESKKGNQNSSDIVCDERTAEMKSVMIRTEIERMKLAAPMCASAPLAACIASAFLHVSPMRIF